MKKGALTGACSAYAHKVRRSQSLLYCWSHAFKRSKSLQIRIETTDPWLYFAMGSKQVCAHNTLLDVHRVPVCATDTQVSDGGLSILQSWHHRVAVRAHTGSAQTYSWPQWCELPMYEGGHSIQAHTNKWYLLSRFLAHNVPYYSNKPSNIINKLFKSYNTYRKVAF